MSGDVGPSLRRNHATWCRHVPHVTYTECEFLPTFSACPARLHCCILDTFVLGVGLWLLGVGGASVDDAAPDVIGVSGCASLSETSSAPSHHSVSVWSRVWAFAFAFTFVLALAFTFGAGGVALALVEVLSSVWVEIVRRRIVVIKTIMTARAATITHTVCFMRSVIMITIWNSAHVVMMSIRYTWENKVLYGR